MNTKMLDAMDTKNKTESRHKRKSIVTENLDIL